MLSRVRETLYKLVIQGAARVVPMIPMMPVTVIVVVRMIWHREM